MQDAGFALVLIVYFKSVSKHVLDSVLGKVQNRLARLPFPEFARPDQPLPVAGVMADDIPVVVHKTFCVADIGVRVNFQCHRPSSRSSVACAMSTALHSLGSCQLPLASTRYRLRIVASSTASG